jgi:hypothetical protein
VSHALLWAGAAVIFAFQWSISAGSMAIVGSLFVIAAFFYKYAPGAAAALETSQAAAESFERLAKARGEQIEEMHAQHLSLNEAIDQGKIDLEAAKDALHSVELTVKDRDAEIAALRAMPDTQAMKAHFDEGFETLAKPIRDLVGMQGDVMQILRAALGPDRPPRKGDPA